LSGFFVKTDRRKLTIDLLSTATFRRRLELQGCLGSCTVTWPDRCIEPHGPDAAAEIDREEKGSQAWAGRKNLIARHGSVEFAADLPRANGGSNGPNDTGDDPANEDSRPVDFSHGDFLHMTQSSR